MARILAIDYGKKRTGLAVTDPLQLIATGLTTVATTELIPFLKKYIQQEEVELIVLGDPRNLDGTATHGTALAAECARALHKHFPQLPVERVDERYTSKMAAGALYASGLPRKKRRNKALLDETSATIMLQEYLQGKQA